MKNDEQEFFCQLDVEGKIHLNNTVKAIGKLDAKKINNHFINQKIGLEGTITTNKSVSLYGEIFTIDNKALVATLVIQGYVNEDNVLIMTQCEGKLHDLSSYKPQYIGKPNCLFNALSPNLRCTINPSGPCFQCPHFESRLV